MAPKRRLSRTFPHKIVLITSLVLCLCAGASIVMGVLAWSNTLWGYNWMTGFWSGGVILMAGIFGIVCSCARNTCSVKTFMIISIFGCLVSLGMIALSAGGLDTNSGFYNRGDRSAFFTHICHAVYLGVGILQLSLCVLSDGICVYYLFVEKNAELYRVKSARQKKQKKKPIVRGEGNRDSTGSQVPLVKRSSSKEARQDNKDNKKSKRKKSQTGTEDADQDLQGDLPIPCTSTCAPLSAKLLRQQEQQLQASPVRNPCVRSASFSTFGHKDGPDRVSLIVHPPDDNSSVAGTTRTHTPAPQGEPENHYAQTLLFDHPLPIEEDDELPPYEVIDTRPYENISSRRHRRPRSEEVQLNENDTLVKRSKSLPSRGKKRSESNKRKRQTRSQIPPGRHELTCESDTDRKQVLIPENEQVVLRHSRSADLLSIEDNSNCSAPAELGLSSNAQGVSRRDFAHLSDRILDNGVQMRHPRPQSAKVVRDRRLDRRRRALSAEVKWNKDQILAHEEMILNNSGLQNRTNSLDGSNSSLFASNRIMPTKFSLRTPIRQVGMPHVCSPVPVKPLQTSDLYSPPPKPPRTHSVTVEDLIIDYVDYADAENVFSEIEKLNEKEDATVSSHGKPKENKQTLNLISPDRNATINKESASSDKWDSHNASTDTKVNAKDAERKINDAVLDTSKPRESQVITLDSGPVLKCAPPKVLVKHEIVKPHEHTPSSVMVVPTSPILKQPVKTPRLKESKKEIKPLAIIDVKQNEHDNKNDKSETKMPAHFESNAKTDKEGDGVVIKNKSSNDKEIMYAKVVKETINSPGVKVQKARKLLYSFSDNDQINVFDPSPLEENAPAIEEHVFEVTDTVSLKHVPEKNVNDTKSSAKKDNDNMNGIKSTVKKGNDGQPIDVDSLKDLRVRLPPMSPSERILQRKNLTTSIDVLHDREITPSHNKSPIVNTPNSVALNGARPKTTVKGEPIPLPRQGSGKKTSPNSANISSVNLTSDTPPIPVSSQAIPSTSTVNSVKPRVFTKPARRPTPPARKSASNNVNNEPNISVQPITSRQPIDQLQNTTNAPTTFSRDLNSNVPSVSTSNGKSRDSKEIRGNPRAVPTSRSANSQGVLHLPQPQHSRQLPGNVPGQHGVGPDAGPHEALAQVANNAINNNNDTNRPLFSMLL